MMKQSKRKRRNPVGRILITAGLLCLLGAAGLGIYNVWDSYRAGKASAEIEAVLIGRIKENMEEESGKSPGKITHR